MALNPLEEPGVPLDRQLRSWRELQATPLHPDDVHPATRCRILAAAAVEGEAVTFGHQFARHVADPPLRRELAMVRRVELQQLQAVQALLPGSVDALEVALVHAQTAIEITAWLARMEPDPYVRQALDLVLVEHVDHLYRYANLLDLIDGRAAQAITGPDTEIMPGRPTARQHRHPHDDVRRAIDARTAAPATVLHVLTLRALAQQALRAHALPGTLPSDPLARALHLELGDVAEQHLTSAESLMDARMSWFERDVWHQYHECWLYLSLLEDEVDPQVRPVWALHLDMEVGQLHAAIGRMRRAAPRRDPLAILPPTPPPLLRVEENRGYIRRVLDEQLELTGEHELFVPAEALPADHRLFQIQQLLNAGGVPSEDVVARRRSLRGGRDVRHEVDGPHPVEHLRELEGAP